ncbi:MULTISPECIES: SAM-dependent methyltransferase [unclassified Beijerinckia]|uniref:class I SAM-dependent methyltransferase n=1 Tax=unclassified Beijerinckia TaxID=2638183 RepID=UPI0008950763|nr:MULTISPECIES: SAM-dependent methyltransferase [unclassified Beijerinckia]MDH7795521.1 NADH dehydrogenase [ubiquinone] 1 alpha subcomplex assembly factor 7 [Beijerinckia sp. GAS462]SEC05033.1 SAM-dependent methyltransferase, MidA family [Beijerinckia sp. 28-YEA-48]
MTPLGAHIRQLIRNGETISLERFMALALGDPERGYYMTRDPFGADGDFTTAPEISQMFGELLGLWAAEVWALMGSPKKIQLVELGPGRGTLMSDALRALQVAGNFAKALTVHLVETSPVLEAQQREILAGSDFKIEWHQSLDTVPYGPSIFLANEFFDALPVRHYVFQDGAWYEKVIGLDEDDALYFGLADDPETSIRARAEENAVFEVSGLGHRVMAELAKRVATDKGAALIIDYGHVETQYGETLQALKSHQPVSPLDEPGEADLTAHVDFAALARTARAMGAAVYGPQRQADFLSKLGIFERANGLKRQATARQAIEVDRALLRLVSTAPERGAAGTMVPGMGALFKVMAVTHPDMPQPPGLQSPPK